MRSRPKLVPLSVNWMISPSTPMLRVCIGEDAVESPTLAEFLAVLANGEERWLRLVFRHGLRAMFNPSHSDKEVVETGAYDWSAVHQLEPGKGFAASLSRFNEQWKQSGLCPNPRAYEVHDSPWLERIRSTVPTATYKHFLLLGHDGYAEVVAEDYTAGRVEDSR
jgi:hypothetical protein